MAELQGLAVLYVGEQWIPNVMLDCTNTRTGNLNLSFETACSLLFCLAMFPIALHSLFLKRLVT